MNSIIARINRRFQGLPLGVKASTGYFVASLVTKGISYLTTPLFTRLLSSEEYGQMSVYFTWFHLFGIFAMFCLSYGVFNNGMVDFPERRDEYSLSMLCLSNIITIFVALICIVAYPYISSYLKVELRYIVVMFLVFLVQPAYTFWAAKNRYELKYKNVVICSIAIAVISPLVAITAIISTHGSKLDARIYGTEFTCIVIYFVFYILLFKRNHFRVTTKYWKAAIFFNLPLIPHYLSLHLLSGSDKLMISYLVSDSATAYYSVAYSIGAVGTIVWTAINSSLIPYTYEKCKENNYSAISRVTIPLLTLYACVCTLIILLAPEMVRIMATKNYLEAIYVIPPIVGGVFFQVQYHVYANILYYYKKPKYVMVGSITATLLNIILNYYLIKKYGYIAAGYTTLFCYMVQAAIDYLAMSHFVGAKIYDIRLIGALSIGVCFIGLFSNLVYDFPIIRYGVVLTLFILFFSFRHKIKSIIIAVKKR